MTPPKHPKDSYVKRALAAGARDARLIPADSVVTAEWVRLKCQYGCDGYGQRRTCPPYSPAPEQTARMLQEYDTALLVHADDHADVTALVAQLERDAFLDGYYRAFARGSGPCSLCETCNLDEEACRHPAASRPAMEACGIDVFHTVRNNGFPIDVVTDQTCQQNYYGLLLLE